MYSWEVVVEGSKWGPLDQYAEKYSALWEKRESSTPVYSFAKPKAQNTVKTIDSYRQQIEEKRIVLLQKLELEKLGDVRKKLWYELIKIEEATGHGISKAVSKLYANWFRAARRKQDAVLDVDEDDHSIIEWGVSESIYHS
jgi:hypothetical protein